MAASNEPRYRGGVRFPDRRDELEDFKTQIDLREVMASRGYLLDERGSSRRYSVMRHAAGDKLIVTRKTNRHWIYANAHDAQDRGTVIDFLGQRDRLSLGEVRKTLRRWLSGDPTMATPPRRFADLTTSEPDANRVIEAWERADLIEGQHDYLERDRGILPRVLSDPIFAAAIRKDVRRNALFAHSNRDGLCGFEIKNRGFTGFSPGGTKGLFHSRPRPDDNELVVGETAIDLLSYAALFGTRRKRFLSVAGQVSPAQEGLLASAAKKMPPGGAIVLALDNDAGGQKLAERLRQVMATPGLSVRTHLPDQAGADWNDVLHPKRHRDVPLPTPA